jgi:DNA-binding beta-propeller fold protein YncE
MRVLVSSARGASGDGYGTILAADPPGDAWRTFSEDGRITDPRGLCVTPGGDLLYANTGDGRVVALDRAGQVVRDTGPADGLDLGGGVFGPDGRYYAGSRRLRTVMVVPASLDGPALPFLARGVVPFPRGFAFAADGRMYLASGMSPAGDGEETIKVFGPGGRVAVPRLVDDPRLSPLDLMLAPNGNVVVSSEWPFGAADASTSVREYDGASGQLVRIFKPDDGSVRFRQPRGLRFGPDGGLCCVARDEVVRFDFETGDYTGTVARLPGLFGQAVEFFG